MAQQPPSGDARRAAATTAGVARQEGRLVVTLCGEFDVGTHHLLAGALGRTLVAATDDVVLDLSDVGFLSLDAVATICAGERTLDEDGRRLSVRAPSPSARLVLDLCGRGDLVERHLRLVPDRGAPRGEAAAHERRRAP